VFPRPCCDAASNASGLAKLAANCHAKDSSNYRIALCRATSRHAVTS
jgi:hypothetical protein